MGVRIGLLSVGFIKFRFDIARTYLEQTPKKLGWKEGELLVYPHVILEHEQLEEAVQALSAKPLDGLIIQIGTFPMGEMMLSLVEAFKGVPLLLWGFEDPMTPEYNTIPLNSLTGINMVSSYLHRLEHPYDYVYGAFDEPSVWDKVHTYKHAVHVKHTLETSKFGVIGSRAPGFYLCEVNQLQFRKEVGPMVEYYAVGDLVERAKAFPDDAVRAVKEPYKARFTSVFNDEQLDKTIRIYLAIKALIKEQRLTALSIKCWPEWQTLYGVSVCPVLSMLNDDDVMTSCEGDITALASMVIAHTITQEPPFLADLATLHSKQVLKAWHCGHVPTRLCALPMALTEHPTMKDGMGLALQGEIKLSDEVTLFKLSETPGGYRLFNTTGYSQSPDRAVDGPQTDIVLHQDAQKVLETIFYEGIEHHYVVAHQALTPALKMLVRFKGWRWIQP